MSQPIQLEYAGRAVERRSAGDRLLRLVYRLVKFCLLTAIAVVRTVLVAMGLACCVVGAVLQMLGGRADAARRLQRWRSHWAGLLRLWVSDIVQPIRELCARRGSVAVPEILPSA